MIPKYHEVYNELIQLMTDRKERKRADIKDELAAVYNLTPDEMTCMTEGGRQTIFGSVVGWAVTYLYQAGLLSRPRHGVYTITERGLTAWNDHPHGINNEFLEQYPEFRRFFHGGTGGTVPPADPLPGNPPPVSETPEQRIQDAMMIIEKNLAEELLGVVMDKEPRFFEQLVIDLLVKMGYGRLRGGSSQVTPYSHDGGIDGVINEDKLGLDKIYVQAKRWNADHPVRRPDVQQFVGALPGTISKGIFITTSTFTEEARKYAQTHSQHSLVLIDGTELANLMIEFDLGVSTLRTYSIKRVDTDYFNPDAE